MKKIIRTSMFLLVLLLSLLATKTHAQNTQPGYKEMIGENPNADADIKTVSDFVNSLVSGDLDKVKNLLSPKYKGYGPSHTDSATVDQTITTWKENYKIQSNRKISFVPQTFKVLQGDLKGVYVAIWGEYSFTQSGKDISFPLQYTAKVLNGKIDMDWVYYDRLYILQSLGFKITPP